MKAIWGILVVALLISGCGRTVYAPGFSENAFKKIKPGMSVGEVIKLVGRPLSKERLEDRLYHVRIASGKIVPAVITYDATGNVDYMDEVISKRWCYSRKTAESCLHTNRSVRLGYRWEWSYTDNNGFGTNRGRRILFDRSGRVDKVHNYDVND